MNPTPAIHVTIKLTVNGSEEWGPYTFNTDANGLMAGETVNFNDLDTMALRTMV